MSAKPLIAADTNVLIDLADGCDAVEDCFQLIRERLPGSMIFVLPTVMEELRQVHYQGQGNSARLARKALGRILNPWHFKPINCIPVGHGITEQIGLKIRNCGLIPEEEVNDSLVIAEAALAGIYILLSSDEHLNGIDQARLGQVLHECEVEHVQIISPWNTQDFEHIFRVPAIAAPKGIVRKFSSR